MSKRKPADSLEAIFGKAFNDIEEVEKKNGWNQPSTEVWENIHSVIQPNKKPNRLIVFWPWMAVAASSLLLVGCFQFYQYNQTIYQLSGRVEMNEKDVKIIKSNFEALKGRIEKEEEVYTETIELNTNLSIEQNQEKASSIYSSLSIENPISSFNTVSSSQVFLSHQERTNTKEIVQNDTRNLEYKKETTIKNTATSSIASLPTLFTLLESKNREAAISTKPISPVFKHKPSFYVSASYTPIREDSKVNSLHFNGAGNFSGSEQQQNNFSTGLQLGVKLAKGWMVESGLRYHRLNKLASHTGSIPYQSLSEIKNNQGVYESSSTIQLGSSSGEVETEIMLSRDPATMVEENANLNLNIAFTKFVSSLEIPFLVKKQWAVGNLSLSIKAGLLNRFIRENNFDAPQINIDDNRFQVRTTDIKKDGNERKPVTYSNHLIAGAGIEYFFLPRLSLYVEPTFTRSLQPSLNGDLANFYSEGKMIDLGFRYQL